MRIQLLTRFYASFCLALALFGLNHRAAAQLSVGPGGLASQAFGSVPAASQFSTLSVGPVVAGGAVSSGAQMDTVIQTNTSARVNLTLPTSATVPPAASGFAQWNSTGNYLQTRANTNWYTLLMATLQNNTGSNIASLNLSYDLATVVAAGTTIIEEIPGHRVYYSLTGAQNSWVHISQFDSPGATNSGTKTATATLGGWAPGATLYILWVDANGSAGAAQEGGYTIDNFAATAVPEQPGPPNIVNQPQSQTVGYPNQVNFSVSSLGTTPLFYQWFKDGVVINGANAATYTINNATLADQGSYHVVVTNSFGSAISSNAVLTVTCAGGTVTPSITTQPADQAIATGGTISLNVVASGTTPTYQWYRAGSIIPGATSATYTKANAQPGDSGVYTVVVANCAGAVTSRSTAVAVTSPGYILVPLTNYTWRYNEANIDLGTAWRGTNYNDASWQSGLGLFAVEDNGALVPLIRTTLTLGSPDIPTHYFRTSFVLTNDPIAITMTSSNYFDDGAVVYVNGIEAFRYNMSTGGDVRFGDLALAANPAGEGTFIVSNIPSSLLRQGVNYVAVEVHQNSPTSSDIDFGMALFVNNVAPTILSITQQPVNLVVEETKPATFSVGVQGAPAYYQWYKDGAAVPGAASNPFTIPIVSTSDAGNYFVVVTNSLNSVTSAVVSLTVLGDTNAPTIVEADGTISNTLVLVSFSELVFTNAINTNNYKITNTLGGTLAVTRAVITNGTNVLLTTALPRQINNNYILIVNNVQDVAPLHNVIVPNSMYPIRSVVPLIAFDSGNWTFIDPYPPFDPDPSTFGTAWKEFTYDTSAWAENGLSILYDAGDPSVISGPLGTSLGQTPTIDSYFRRGFVLQASPGGLLFSLSHFIDDGAVLYLNGAEFYRFNMPAGPIAYDTLPVAAIGNVVRQGPFQIPATSLRFGSNMLAAELHQLQAADIDKVFGIQLDAHVQSFVVGPVIITSSPRDITVVEGSPGTFSVVQVGASGFQWFSSNSTAVTLIPGATNSSYTVSPATSTLEGTGYFVVATNGAAGPTAGARSGLARLHVITDTNRPALLGAALTTNGTVVVSFSERMGANALTTSNYRITNSSGGNIPINGATFANNNSNVVLTVGSMPTNTYTLVVSGVQDAATSPNTISPNPTLARIGYQGPAVLLGLAATWKYDQSGADLGTAWRGVGFNDTAWASGQATFGLEATTLPEPIRTAWTLDGKITYYLRTTINAPVGGSSATLRLRTLLDDGAVFYLNGVEIQRIRIAGGVNVTSATLADNQATEATFEIIDIVVTNLLAGQNLVAVEVHQTSATSSDVVFAGELTLLSVDSQILASPNAVQIVTPPQSRTNALGTVASFSVTATGDGPLFYQWQKNNGNITGATNSTYTISSVTQNDAGSYRVIVTNSFSSATSAAAVLTIAGGGNCTNVEPRLVIARSDTNLILSWSNPTNSCGSVVPYILRSTTALPVPPAAGVWTTNAVASPVTVGPTNSARFFQLIKQ